MTGDQLAATVGAGLCLTLVAAGLMTRRLPAATLAKMSMAWAAIIIGLVLLLRLLS